MKTNTISNTISAFWPYLHHCCSAFLLASAFLSDLRNAWRGYLWGDYSNVRDQGSDRWTGMRVGTHQWTQSLSGIHKEAQKQPSSCQWYWPPLWVVPVWVFPTCSRCDKVQPVERRVAKLWWPSKFFLILTANFPKKSYYKIFLSPICNIEIPPYPRRLSETPQTWASVDPSPRVSSHKFLRSLTGPLINPCVHIRGWYKKF